MKERKKKEKRKKERRKEGKGQLEDKQMEIFRKLAEKRGKWQSETNSEASTVNSHYRHTRSSVRRKGKRWSEQTVWPEQV